MTNPDKLNEPQIGADALAAYFSDGLKSVPAFVFDWIDMTSLDKIAKLQLSSLMAFQINAGMKTDLNNPTLEIEHGHQLLVLGEIYNILTPAA